MLETKTRQGLLQTLDANGMWQFLDLQAGGVKTVCERLHATQGDQFRRFGALGKDACSEDLAFHLEFLAPVLEYRMLPPMVDYLLWRHAILSAHALPTWHLSLSLEWFAEFFAERMVPPAGPLVTVTLRAARRRYEQTSGTPFQHIALHEPWPEAADSEAALLDGHRPRAIAIMQECLARDHRLVDCEPRVIQPALYAIGAKWQNNLVSVAQKHLATAIAQSVMALALPSTPPASSVDKRVWLSCVAGNHHALGLQVVADAFLVAGWKVQLLGADAPDSALLQQTAAWRPDLIGLSISLPQQAREARAFMAPLHARFGDARPAVMVGELACNRLGVLAVVIGADLTGIDSRAAVKSAQRLLLP